MTPIQQSRVYDIVSVTTVVLSDMIEVLVSKELFLHSFLKLQWTLGLK